MIRCRPGCVINPTQYAREIRFLSSVNSRHAFIFSLLILCRPADNAVHEAFIPVLCLLKDGLFESNLPSMNVWLVSAVSEWRRDDAHAALLGCVGRVRRFESMMSKTWLVAWENSAEQRECIGVDLFETTFDSERRCSYD